ncbi:MAG: Hsp20/alpha crystallin family protein [Proteobacteria bacterium]|nr:Hsp20/alpha crystallin family protein [Pseudomonadota bacterium]
MKKKKSKELIRTEPSRLPSTFEEMESLFDQAFRRPFSLLGHPWWTRIGFPEMEAMSPSVDIFREGNNVVVKAEIPGMTKEDINVTLTEDKITISGEKKKEEKVEKKDYYRYESSEGSFCRSFHLPEDVQTDKAKAKFKNGVLEIKIPMTEEAKKREKKVVIE